MVDVKAAISYVCAALAESANPDKAVGMQAYMKTDMPFYGVQKSGRTKVFRHIRVEYAPETRDSYVALTTALWELPHREEKYLALAVAGGFKQFVVPESLPLYRRLIVEGAWWDFVDDVAVHMIRKLVLDYPHETWPTVDVWNEDEDLWLRRTSIICQVGAKERTDSDRLFRFCVARLDEKEFFIRKAIGWALRDYAKTDPAAVADFATRHRNAMAGLSFREATKHIGHLVDS
jgi:3-methyladenine DNA glycosylase AlkD